MTKAATLLQPRYLAGFQCIGPACEDDCCHAWDIAVDKRTYQRYRECPDLTLRARLDKCVARNRGTANDLTYAKIRPTEKGGCPFFDTDRLCTLQRNLGEKYLSETCAMYPRTFRKVNATWEAALHLSCPEAARAALLNPNLMEFEFVANPFLCANKGYPEFNPEDSGLKTRAEHYFWPLRSFSITLLQNRTYPLWQRLVILGLFCQAVQNAAGDPGEIPALIGRYNNLIDQGIFKSELEAIPSRGDIQLNILGQLLAYRLTGNGVIPQFLDCVDKIKTAIAPDDESDQDILAQNYKTAFEMHYSPFMADREYILENYLVNYVFKNAFPFGKKQVFDDYAMLVIHYAILKMLLIGLAGYYKEGFSVGHVIQLVYSFSRTIEHHPAYLRDIHQLFTDNELNSLSYMAIFIRN